MVQNRNRFFAGALPFVFLGALVFINYVGTLKAGFVYDDHMQILENVSLRSLHNIPSFFTDPAHTSGGKVFEDFYRPIRASFLAVEFQLWRHNPIGYHAVNIILHAINSFLVLIFLKYILRSSAPAFAAALVFACHPAITENVCWITCQGDLLCMFFYLISAVCYFSSRENDGLKKRLLYIVAVAALPLAMLSKEMGVTFVAMIATIDIWRGGLRGEFTKRWKEYAPFVLITVAYLIVRISIVSQLAHRSPLADNPFDMALIIAGEITYYVRLLLFPFNLTVTPAINTDVSLLQGEILGTVALVLILIAAIIVFRNRSTETSLGIALFLVLLLPILNIIPILPVVANRFIYIPSLGFLIVLGTVFRGVSSSENRRSRRGNALVAGAIAGLIFFLSLNTIVQCLDWRSNFSLFKSAVEITPNNARAQLSLAKEYYFLGDYDAARKHCLIALRLAPGFAEAHSAMGRILVAEGLVGPAMQEFKTALSIDPFLGDANNNLGLIYAQHGKLDEALVAFKNALKKRPSAPVTLNNIGNVLSQKGEYDEALKYFEKSLNVNPADPVTANNMALSLVNKGEYARAVDFMEKRMATRPTNLDMLILLGVAHSNNNNEEAALHVFRRAASIDPDDPRVRHYIADLEKGPNKGR
jgi:Tfp pilus assembly protein PilF